MEITTYSIDNGDAWDRLMLEAVNYTFFHSMAWGRAIVDTYGFRQFYISAKHKGDFAAIPLMLVHRPWSKKRAVCLPFSDSCGPVFTARWILDLLLDYVQSQMKLNNWKELEIRADSLLEGVVPFEKYIQHSVPLDRDIDAVFKALRSSTKRNIQQAEKKGVKAEISQKPAAMDIYYGLHCVTRKRLGVPPQPKAFFNNIQKYVIARGNGFIIQSKYEGMTIASAVFLHFGGKVVYKFGASLLDKEHLRPSNLMMWEAILFLKEKGFKTLSLGRTDPNDSGLMQYKNGWGTQCREIGYYVWPQRKFS